MWCLMLPTSNNKTTGGECFYDSPVYYTLRLRVLHYWGCGRFKWQVVEGLWSSSGYCIYMLIEDCRLYGCPFLATLLSIS